MIDQHMRHNTPPHEARAQWALAQCVRPEYGWDFRPEKTSMVGEAWCLAAMIVAILGFVGYLVVAVQLNASHLS